MQEKAKLYQNIKGKGGNTDQVFSINAGLSSVFANRICLWTIILIESYCRERFINIADVKPQMYAPLCILQTGPISLSLTTTHQQDKIDTTF